MGEEYFKDDFLDYLWQILISLLKTEEIFVKTNKNYEFCADYTYGRKNSLAPVRRSNLGSRCIAPPGGNLKKIQLTIIRNSPRHSPSRPDLLAHDVPPPPGNCSPSRCQWAMMANCQWQDPLPDQSTPPFSAGDQTCHYCFFVFSSRLRL